MARRKDDNVEQNIAVPLDGDTREWLSRLSLATGDPMGRIVASMLRDIRADDEACHSQLH